MALLGMEGGGVLSTDLPSLIDESIYFSPCCYLQEVTWVGIFVRLPRVGSVWLPYLICKVRLLPA
jgi:hypothetical protein